MIPTSLLLWKVRFLFVSRALPLIIVLSSNLASDESLTSLNSCGGRIEIFEICDAGLGGLPVRPAYFKFPDRRACNVEINNRLGLRKITVAGRHLCGMNCAVVIMSYDPCADAVRVAG